MFTIHRKWIDLQFFIHLERVVFAKKKIDLGMNRVHFPLECSFFEIPYFSDYSISTWAIESAIKQKTAKNGLELFSLSPAQMCL